MDTIEIVVYIAVAVIVGGLILMVTLELSGSNVYDSLRDLIVHDDVEAFAKVDNTTLPSHLFKVWKECGLGSLPLNVTIQYEGAPISKTEIFSSIKNMRLCRTLSSLSEECGNREDLVNTTPIASGILLIRCKPSTQQLFSWQC